jgi:predicted phosphodiesterase
MSKISFNPSKDTLIHVGDLIAKGDKNEEVLQWMIKHSIQGVRGNHDQPVCPFSHEVNVKLIRLGGPVASVDGVGRWERLGELCRQAGG